MIRNNAMRKSMDCGKFVLLFSIFIVLCLCGCGSKPQPSLIDTPTAVYAPDTAGSAEEPYDPFRPGSVVRYYSTIASRIFSSFAFLQTDTEGKTVWTAPLAGIQGFTVPEAFLNAKGGIRAGGGQELFRGSGIVCMNVVYLPYTEAEYDAFLDRIAEFEKEHEVVTEEYMLAYTEMLDDYNNNAYILFDVMGISENRTPEDLKTGIREIHQNWDIPEEETEKYLKALDIIKAGSAEDFNFYLVRQERASGSFKKSQTEYREEYDALYDAFADYADDFTFMRPLALSQLITEGTEFVFETKDLENNPVTASEMFGGHKATMVNIWETTCSACVSEMPVLKDLAEEFEKKGGHIVGLVYDASDDEMIAEAKEIAENLELNFVNLLPTQEIKDFFKAQAFPTTFFFNEKGEVIGEPILGADPDLYAARMNELLAAQ